MAIDIEDLSRAVDKWKESTPRQALALRQRLQDLELAIAELPGKFPRDLEEERIYLEAHKLDKEMPELLEVLNSAGDALEATRQVGVAGRSVPSIQGAAEDFAEEYDKVLTHLLNVTYEGRAVGPLSAQVRQLRSWARYRLNAIKLMEELATLQASATPTGAAVLKTVSAEWARVFKKKDVQDEWLDEARAQLAELSKEFSLQATPAMEPSGPEAAVLHRQINQTLYTCNELAEALRQAAKGSTAAEQTDKSLFLGKVTKLLAAFDRRHASHQEETHTASLQVLQSEIDACLAELQTHAEAEKKERFHLVETNWKRIENLYPSYDITENARQSIKRALAPATKAVGLLEFIRITQEALEAITYTIQGNPPPLTKAIDEQSVHCRELVKNLNKLPRTEEMEVQLIQLEKRLPPENSASQGDAEKWLEWLTDTEQVHRELLTCKQVAQKFEAATDARRKKLAALVKLIEDCEPSKRNALRDVTQRLELSAPLAGIIDDLLRDLDGAETQIAEIERRVRERVVADLTAKRRETGAWIEVLRDYKPEAAQFLHTGMPEALADLQNLQQAMQDQEPDFIRMAGEAIQTMEERCDKVKVALTARLELPKWKPHPDRERAEGLLADLGPAKTSLKTLRAELITQAGLDDASARSTLNVAHNSLYEAEEFLHRLDADRVRVQQDLKRMTSRFSSLKELNASFYRPAMTHRIQSLITGTQRALLHDQLEDLRFQLEHTEHLLKLLEGDLHLQVSAETEDLCKQLGSQMELSRDDTFQDAAQSLLNQLERTGQLTPPSYMMRQKLRRLLNGQGPGYGTESAR